MVEFGKKKDLEKKIKQVFVMLEQEKDPTIKIALYNYIGNLYSALSVVTGKKMYPDKQQVFGSIGNFRKFMRKTDQYLKENMENFVFYKDFHQEYFNDVLLISEENFVTKLDEETAKYCSNTERLSKKEFLTIFHDFCSSLGLEKEYEEIIHDRRLFSMTKGDDYDNYLGLTTHNPLTGESNIFIDHFQYDFQSLFTLVHELGHYYDLKEFASRDTIHDFSDYTFKSLYQEVISRMFERLFLSFLIRKRILLDEATDKLIDVELINHDYMFSAYCFSLLEDDLLLRGQYLDFSGEDLYQSLFKYFNCDKDSFCELVGKPENFMEDVVYSYGDIFSMFLREVVEAEGLNSPFMKKFQKERVKEFDNRFMLREGLNSSQYEGLFQKEIQLIKK